MSVSYSITNILNHEDHTNLYGIIPFQGVQIAIIRVARNQGIPYDQLLSIDDCLVNFIHLGFKLIHL
jgi:hypothetical protein